MTREEAIEVFKTEHPYNPNRKDNDLHTLAKAFDMAISALEKNESAEEWYKLLCEKWDSAEGEYIKKEDVLDKIVEQLPQRAYMKCQKAIESLPAYSFPDREKETPKLFIDNAVSKKCKNLSESYGEICVKCNKCGRFDKAEITTDFAIEYLLDDCDDCPENENGECLTQSHCFEVKQMAIKALRMMDKAENKGEWIKIKSGDKDFPESIVCSKCKNENSHLDFNEHNEPIGKVFVTSKFCPNCGADMRGGE